MEGRISTIKKLELRKEDIESMIMFDAGLSASDLNFLEEEFDFYKEDVNNFTANYKNIGVVFKLTPIKEELLKDWKTFIQRLIKKSYEFDKFNNIFVSKKYDKILLVSNKRLLGVDLKKLNGKIEEINYRIESYDDKALAEMESVVDATKEEHKGIFSKVMEVLRK